MRTAAEIELRFLEELLGEGTPESLVSVVQEYLEFTAREKNALPGFSVFLTLTIGGRPLRASEEKLLRAATAALDLSGYEVRLTSITEGFLLEVIDNAWDGS